MNLQEFKKLMRFLAKAKLDNITAAQFSNILRGAGFRQIKQANKAN